MECVMMARLVTTTGRVAAGAAGGRLRPTLLGCFSPNSSVLLCFSPDSKGKSGLE